MLAPVTEFRIFDERLSCCQKLKVYLFTLLLTLLGGFLTWLPYAAPQLKHQRPKLTLLL